MRGFENKTKKVPVNVKAQERISLFYFKKIVYIYIYIKSITSKYRTTN